MFCVARIEMNVLKIAHCVTMEGRVTIHRAVSPAFVQRGGLVAIVR